MMKGFEVQTRTSAPAAPAARHHRWWLVFPFVWQAGLAPAVNDVALRPLGLPFPMAWQMLGIVLTTVVIAWVFHRDARADLECASAAAARRPGSPA